MGAPLTVFRATFFLLLVIVAVLAYACGDDDETSGEPAASFPAGGGGGDGAEVQEFNISFADNTFEPAEFTVAGGVIVQFNITSGGAAIHNMRTGGADNVFNDEDDAVSDPPLVNGGETAVLQWAAPVAGGTFDFRCDFHPEAMVGTITVEKGEESGNGGQEGP
ncbi:MAG: cupredoxin domain-containing protein [Chloroflexota bacterium]